jgi:Fe-S oxidoreductase
LNFLRRHFGVGFRGRQIEPDLYRCGGRVEAAESSAPPPDLAFCRLRAIIAETRDVLRKALPPMSETAPPRVGLFVTCLVDLFRPSVGFAAVKLLEAAGCVVEAPRAQTCCGQPAYNSGDRPDARTLAAQVIAACCWPTTRSWPRVPRSWPPRPTSWSRS